MRLAPYLGHYCARCPVWALVVWLERATLKFSIEGNEWFAELETPAEQVNASQEKI
jgi:hypothetical protein